MAQNSSTKKSAVLAVVFCCCFLAAFSHLFPPNSTTWNLAPGFPYAPIKRSFFFLAGILNSQPRSQALMAALKPAVTDLNRPWLSHLEVLKQEQLPFKPKKWSIYLCHQKIHHGVSKWFNSLQLLLAKGTHDSWSQFHGQHDFHQSDGCLPTLATCRDGCVEADDVGASGVPHPDFAKTNIYIYIQYIIMRKSHVENWIKITLSDDF